MGSRCRRLACRLFVVSSSVLALVAFLAFAPPPAAAQPTLTACDSDSDCTGVDEACVFSRCLRVACNADLDCTRRLPACINGSCQAGCEDDADCSAGACVQGRCEPFECETDAQCGDNGVCRDHSCVCVECRRSGQCADDETCAENRCEPFCEEGRVFVTAPDGNCIVRACVDPDTHPRCTEFPGCRRGQTICAQGFCVPGCALKLPDFGRIGDDFPEELPYELDPDGNPPECPKCTAVFHLARLRTALERAGVKQPVTVRLLHSSGQPLAELGSFKPNRGSWAAVPLRAQPPLQGELAKEGGCGFTLELRAEGAKPETVRIPVCLQGRR